MDCFGLDKYWFLGWVQQKRLKIWWIRKRDSNRRWLPFKWDTNNLRAQTLSTLAFGTIGKQQVIVCIRVSMLVHLDKICCHYEEQLLTCLCALYSEKDCGLYFLLAQSKWLFHYLYHLKMWDALWELLYILWDWLSSMHFGVYLLIVPRHAHLLRSSPRHSSSLCTLPLL